MEKTRDNRSASMVVGAYPYRMIDMFDCWGITDKEGIAKDLLKEMDNIKAAYERHGYKVRTNKVSYDTYHEIHTIWVDDVFVKKFNKRMKSMFVSVSIRRRKDSK